MSDMAASRPPADHTLEQFLMTRESLRKQVGFLASKFGQHQSIFIIGDDDHVSPLLAIICPRLMVTIIEIDGRVCDNLCRWRRRLGLTNLDVINLDIRQVNTCCFSGFDSFYANPPYSSKNDGHGLRAWAFVCLQACRDECRGVVAMPWMDHPEQWVRRNWVAMRAFLTSYGCSIVRHRAPLCEYGAIRHAGMRSWNWAVHRHTPLQGTPEPPAVGCALYR
ncbi:MAG: bis-aminopropyl spermidine synthase family protein [Phycisphaerales bacterium]|nr:bis-aminopropyl spermidine synthase family protein [Phycisphaerales bacterium]